MATPYHKNPSPGGHEIYNFGTPFLGHHYYILNLSDHCPNVDKKMRRNIAFSLYVHSLAQEPSPGGYEIYNFGRPLVIITTYTFSLSDLCPSVENDEY